tara:strand:- start:151 stop:1116 length:966 start_codon:yes stop_codon:yes gene_type:complete
MAVALSPEALTDLNRLEDYLAPSSTFPTSDSDIFVHLINGLSHFVLTFLGRDSLKYRSTTEYHDGDGTQYISTDNYPIIDVTSIHDDNSSPTTRDYDSSYLVNSSYYEIYNNSENDRLGNGGIIRNLNGTFSRGRSNIKVIYNSGYSQYQVMQYFMDRLIVNEDGTQVTVDMTPGKYNGVALATMIQNVLNADSTLSGTYTCTYDVDLHRFVITAASVTTFSLIWTATDPRMKEFGKLLGFNVNADDTGQLYYVSDYSALGVPAQLIESMNVMVRFKYEEIRERRIGKVSESSSEGSFTFNYSGLPAHAIDMFLPFRRLRV